MWLIGCFAAFATLLMVVESDPRVVAYCARLVQKSIESTVKLPLAMTPHSVRLLNGRITLCDVGAVDPDGDWSWSAARMHVDMNYLASLFARQLKGMVTFEGLQCSSRAEKRMPTISRYIAPYLSGAAAPALMQTTAVIIDHAEVEIDEDPMRYRMLVKAYVPFERNGLVHVTIRGLQVMYRDTTYIEGGALMCSYDPLYDAAEFDCSGDCMVQESSDRHWAFRGSLRKGVGVMRGGTRHAGVHCIVRANRALNSIECEGQVPVAVLMRGALQPYQAEGTIQFSGVSSFRNPLEDLMITATIRNLSCAGIAMPDSMITAQSVHKDPRVQFKLLQNENVYAEGTVQYQNATWLFEGALKNDYVAPAALTLQKGAFVRGSFNPVHMACDGVYGGRLSRADISMQCKGTFECNSKHARLRGACGGYTYEIGAILRDWMLQSAQMKIMDKQPIARCSFTPKDGFRGSIEYGLLASVLKGYGISSSGEGAVQYAVRYENGKIHGSYTLDQATVKIPAMYNMVQGVRGSCVCDIKTRTVSVPECVLRLHQGSVSVVGATCEFSPSGAPTFVHIPVMLTDCFAHVNQSLFAAISGALVVRSAREPAGGYSIQGSVLIDRSHMQGNIFDADFAKRLFGVSAQPVQLEAPKTSYDIHILTKQPLRVKTPFLEAAAACHVQCTGSPSAFRMKGFVELTQGSLLFPYKPLFVQHGLLLFDPHSPDDPRIEIHAENSIKGYTVNLDVSGSISNPSIMLSASPHLEDDKIIGLLWGGSEDGSLYLAMSTTIMQSLERLLFGPAEGSSQLKQAVTSLFKPLGSIRLVPGFTEQVGRGGIRGSLAVEVNDRLRGIIKQNFELPQDTMLEVEYALSDDARVRGFKDERGDVGAELEGRWKF